MRLYLVWPRIAGIEPIDSDMDAACVITAPSHVHAMRMIRDAHLEFTIDSPNGWWVIEQAEIDDAFHIGEERKYKAELVDGLFPISRAQWWQEPV